LSDSARDLIAAQSEADSIAFDLHKWGYMPYEIGCVLIRHGKSQHTAFSTQSSYLSSFDRGLSVNATYFADRGLQLSRGFRALKAWMSLKEQGVKKLGRIIQQNIDQARYLERLVETHVSLELLAPVSLNIVCFRYVDAGLNDQELNALNQEILLRIQESGLAAPSQTLLDNKFAIRACITNHRTRRSDLDMLVDAVERHAKQILVC